MSTSTPTPDQTYCDISNHQACTGYTEDEADPESCMCDCHSEADELVRAAEAAADHTPPRAPASSGDHAIAQVQRITEMVDTLERHGYTTASIEGIRRALAST